MPPSTCATPATSAGTCILRSRFHGMDAAMGVSRSKLPYLVFCGGITGTTVAFTLQTITQTNFWSSIGLGFLEKSSKPIRPSCRASPPTSGRSRVLPGDV
jgi:hypothetical protein